MLKRAEMGSNLTPQREIGQNRQENGNFDGPDPQKMHISLGLLRIHTGTHLSLIRNVK